MAALRKPHRVAFLLPEVTLEGSDAAFERRRRCSCGPRASRSASDTRGSRCYDPESTPLLPKDDHFSPRHAGLGATPTDGFFGTDAPRRTGVARGHRAEVDGGPAACARARWQAEIVRCAGQKPRRADHSRCSPPGSRRVVSAALPRRFDPCTADELLGVVRILGPVLVEQARVWTLPATEPALAASVELDGDDDDGPADDGGAAAEARREQATALTRPKAARALANRLPATLKLFALRLLELALREDLGDLDARARSRSAAGAVREVSQGAPPGP